MNDESLRNASQARNLFLRAVGDAGNEMWRSNKSAASWPRSRSVISSPSASAS